MPCEVFRIQLRVSSLTFSTSSKYDPTHSKNDSTGLFAKRIIQKVLTMYRTLKSQVLIKARESDPSELSLTVEWTKKFSGPKANQKMTVVVPSGTTTSKILLELGGIRGRQDHHNAYMVDFTVLQMADGDTVAQFKENLINTRQGALRHKTQHSRQ